MKDETVKAVGAMVCITFLTGVALLQGINGYLYGLAMTILGGLGGYALAKRSSNTS